MSKQQVHIKLDNQIYLMLKTNGVNISHTANKLFKSFLAFEKLPNQEEEQIISELENLKKEKDKIQEQITNLSAFLVHVREEKITKEKETNRDLDNLSDGLLRAGVLYD